MYQMNEQRHVSLMYVEAILFVAAKISYKAFYAECIRFLRCIFRQRN